MVGGPTSETHFLDFDLRGRDRGAEPGEARAAPEAEAEAVSPPCTTGATSWGFGRPQSERPRDRSSGTLRAPARSPALPTCPRAPESLAGFVQRVPCARGCEEACEVTDERRGDRGRPPFLVRGALRPRAEGRRRGPRTVGAQGLLSILLPGSAGFSPRASFLEPRTSQWV